MPGAINILILIFIWASIATCAPIQGEGLVRRQSAGIQPEMVGAVVDMFVGGIESQLSKVADKAKEIDQKGGSREEKIGELEAEINEISLALSKKLAEQAKKPPQEKPEEAKEEEFKPIGTYDPPSKEESKLPPKEVFSEEGDSEEKDSEPQSEEKDSKDNSEQEPEEEAPNKPNVKVNSYDMSPAQTKEFQNEMNQMKDDLASDMADMKKELSQLRRRQLPNNFQISPEMAQMISDQVSQRVRDDASQDPNLAQFSDVIGQSAAEISMRAVSNLNNNQSQ